MSRSKSKEGEAPSDDYGLRWGEPVDGHRNNVRCEFCDKVIKGGITRLKEHLPAKKGNVAPWPNVSAEKYNVEEQELVKIQLMYLGEVVLLDLENSEDHSVPLILKEVGVNISGVILTFLELDWQIWIPFSKNQKSSKQPKLAASFLKNAKVKLGKAISKLILHEALPTRIVELPFLQPILQVAVEVGKSVRGPSTYEVTGVYLEEEFREIQERVKEFKSIWEERSVTIMCDRWKGTRNQHIINFLIYSPRDTIFRKSIAASNITYRTAEYYFDIMEKMVDEIGENFIVQFVTDNEVTIKAGGKMLMQNRRHMYWSACSAHCLDLILEEIGNKKSVKMS
ncbi:hypothetical protein F3Y22_tig00110239pilonHSYRG00274 [Hibiscus syriacus]|uniref:DUF659 domain-containing protein n=1 Tax=Hibiscus syriacus TaxID=106335 RepID=A0A6A3BC25_HIBSY|nr:uncharacterized protein LOC120114667 [Hibiscus syriacus]KAE8712652.1 hypothetical protein F3Y22_tig00110239pilonHSYRG00274 [Hibiscus syriacus]